MFGRATITLGIGPHSSLSTFAGLAVVTDRPRYSFYSSWPLVLPCDLIITRRTFVVLSSWQSRGESSLGAFDESILNTRWLLSLRPNRLEQSPTIKAAAVRIHQLHLLLLLLLGPEDGNRFTVAWTVEG